MVWLIQSVSHIIPALALHTGIQQVHEGPVLQAVHGVQGQVHAQLVTLLTASLWATVSPVSKDTTCHSHSVGPVMTPAHSVRVMAIHQD